MIFQVKVPPPRVTGFWTSAMGALVGPSQPTGRPGLIQGIVLLRGVRVQQRIGEDPAGVSTPERPGHSSLRFAIRVRTTLVSTFME